MMLLLLCLPMLAYVAWLWSAARKLARWPKQSGVKADSVRICILIPARNEAPNIAACLRHIRAQQVRVDLHWQVVVVDDHSTDNTAGLAKQSLAGFHRPWHVLPLPEGRYGKKAALEWGIEHLQNQVDVMLCTDADTQAPPHWLAEMTACFDAQTMLVAGPIALTGKSLFQRVQALESAGLVALAAADLASGTPSLANGANLAYRVAAFNTLQGFSGHRHWPSGDDDLLLHRMHQVHPGGLRYAWSPNCVVHTPAEARLKRFWQQRLRWAGKSRAYGQTPAGRRTQRKQALALWAAAFPLLILPFALLWPELWWVAGLHLTIKMAGDLPLLWCATRCLGNANLLPLYPVGLLWQLLYIPALALWIILAGRSYAWKDRRVGRAKLGSP